MKDFSSEVSIQQKAGERIAPEVGNTFLCTEDGGIWGSIIMRKMEGTLYDYLQKHLLTQADLNQILALVKELHKKNIVHQDLHTKNILYRTLDGKVEFYLTDFGLSHSYESGDPQERSRARLNFTQRAIGGTKEEQIAFDFHCLLTDLKNKFGLQIETPQGFRLLTQEADLLTLRDLVIDAYSNQNHPLAEDNQELRKNGKLAVKLPSGKIQIVNIDPDFMSKQTQSVLQAQRSLKLNFDISQ
jgi:serine/threonine protein kinase